MTQMTGTVQRVNEKQLPSGLYHSFLLDDIWYRTGKLKAKGIEAGYKVQFDFTEDKYGKQVDIKSIKFKAGEAPPATNSGSKKAVGRDDFWSNKEVRDIDTQKKISFQAAYNTAINIVNGALDRGYITIPKSAKVEAKLELYEEILHNQAVELFAKYQRVAENYDEYMQEEVEVANEDDLSNFTEDQVEDSQESDDWDE